MPATQDCTVNALIVQLQTPPQQLEYTISGDPDVHWVLSTEGGQVILKSPAPKSCLWPTGAHPASGTEEKHGLAIAFGGDGHLRWTVDRVANGTFVERLKDCTYSNTGDPADWLDALTIVYL